MVIIHTVYLFLLGYAECTKSTLGKEFYIGIFSSNKYPSTSEARLDIVASEPGQLQVEIPFLGRNSVHDISQGSTALTFSRNLTSMDTFIEQRGIYLKSTVDISVYASSVSSDESSGTYIAFPLHSLGKRYSVASHNPYYSSSVFMVVACEDNTLISVVFSNGTTAEKILNRLDVYQQTNETDALSGTQINADKTVSVISGNTCTPVVLSLFYCEITITQLLPTNHWDQSYIIPVVHDFEYLKFPSLQIYMSKNNQRNICLRFLDNSTCFESTANKTFLETSIEEEPVEPVTVVAENPLQIFEYAENNNGGDPFRIIVPGISQYLSEYTFTVPEIYSSLDHLLTITVPKSQVENLRLDGDVLPTHFAAYNVPEPFSNYEMRIYGITNGLHHIVNTHGVPFGVLCYGAGSRINYGYPPGLLLPDEGTTSRLRCFQCADMYHAYLCDKIVECSDSQVCSIERYSHNGHMLYNSGCKNKSDCWQESSANCEECCYDDHCNNKGCGDPGLKPRDERGATCYKCNQVTTPDECREVKLCSSDEVCFVEERESGDSSYFNLGCASRECDLHSDGELGQRDTPVCGACCKDDYCNANCTRASNIAGQLIG